MTRAWVTDSVRSRAAWMLRSRERDLQSLVDRAPRTASVRAGASGLAASGRRFAMPGLDVERGDDLVADRAR